MKKKDYLSKKDKEDWLKFTKDPSPVHDKDKVYIKKDNSRKRLKFDLHGFTLDEANKKVKEIILSSYEKNYKEILLITGKGLHSSEEDVYKSTKLNKLKHSVPNFINSEPEILKLVLSINTPSEKEGGEGAILIKLKS